MPNLFDIDDLWPDHYDRVLELATSDTVGPVLAGQGVDDVTVLSQLCGMPFEIAISCPHIEVVSRRLPRMHTDQTASFLPEEPHAPSGVVMLEAIREMHAPTSQTATTPR